MHLYPRKRIAECDCPSDGGNKNGHIRCPSYGGTQKNNNCQGDRKSASLLQLSPDALTSQIGWLLLPCNPPFGIVTVFHGHKLAPNRCSLGGRSVWDVVMQPSPDAEDEGDGIKSAVEHCIMYCCNLWSALNQRQGVIEMSKLLIIMMINNFFEDVSLVEFNNVPCIYRMPGGELS